MLEIYVQFWCQRFLETGEVSWPGTSSIEQGGPVRVANHKEFFLSCGKFMSKSVVNVFSKQARFHDLGPIPSNRGDLRGWPIIKGFFSIMWEIYVQFWCQRFLESSEVSWPGTNSIECRGPARMASHKGFFPIVIFHVGNLCPILVSTFSRNMRGFMTWDQFRRIQGTCKCGQSCRVLFISFIFMLEILV